MDNGYIKDKIVIAIIVAAFIFSGCEIVNEIESVFSEELESYEAVQTAAAPTEVTDEVAGDGAPSLPDMDFFEDGYEIVEFSCITEGSTASFIMGGLSSICFLVKSTLIYFSLLSALFNDCGDIRT